MQIKQKNIQLQRFLFIYLQNDIFICCDKVSIVSKQCIHYTWYQIGKRSKFLMWWKNILFVSQMIPLLRKPLHSKHIFKYIFCVNRISKSRAIRVRLKRSKARSRSHITKKLSSSNAFKLKKYVRFYSFSKDINVY